jgi:hypothetical protein
MIDRFIVVRDKDHYHLYGNDNVIHNYKIGTIVYLYDKNEKYIDNGWSIAMREPKSNYCQIVHYNDVKPYPIIKTILNIKLL